LARPAGLLRQNGLTQAGRPSRGAGDLPRPPALPMHATDWPRGFTAGSSGRRGHCRRVSWLYRRVV